MEDEGILLNIAWKGIKQNSNIQARSRVYRPPKQNRSDEIFTQIIIDEEIILSIKYNSNLMCNLSNVILILVVTEIFIVCLYTNEYLNNTVVKIMSKVSFMTIMSLFYEIQAAIIHV